MNPHTGKCFKSAFDSWKFLVGKNKHPILVHANVSVDGLFGAHAWVEYEGLALDYTQNEDAVHVPIEDYIEAMKPQQIIRYDVDEVTLNFMLDGNIHWADWLIFES